MRGVATRRPRGAAATSVPTEPTFFDGSLADRRSSRRGERRPGGRTSSEHASSKRGLARGCRAAHRGIPPVVAGAAGAETSELRRQPDVPVECDSGTTAVAICVKGEIVGVNNRNLRTLAVDVRASEDLMAGIPAGVVAVSESGLKTTADLQHLRTAGYSAFLIGERFMLADDPEAAVRQLLAGGADAESALNT